jgi:hypothetical protein
MGLCRLDVEHVVILSTVQWRWLAKPLGDALVPERGARRATGSCGIPQPLAGAVPGCGRGRPMPFTWPLFRRGLPEGRAGDWLAKPLGDALVPERGARRATGSCGIPQPLASAVPGCGRGRPMPFTWPLFRRGPPKKGAGDWLAKPLGDALVPERGARRATGSRGIPQPLAGAVPGCGRGRPMPFTWPLFRRGPPKKSRRDACATRLLPRSTIPPSTWPRRRSRRP